MSYMKNIASITLHPREPPQKMLKMGYEDWLARYLPLTEIATVTSATADAYADIRLELKRLGTPIPPNDIWIAALARQHALAVLSNDGHFDVVNGVRRIAF